MSNNENQPSKLPPAPLSKPDITEGVTPLPSTALLSEAERKRLQELAASGQAPVEPVASDKEETITTFEDGSVFKYIPRAGSATQQIIVDATGKQIAIVKDDNLAEFLCNAANLFVLAQLKHEHDGTQMQIVSKPIIFPGK
jgi:hypothetical protein